MIKSRDLKTLGLVVLVLAILAVFGVKGYGQVRQTMIDSPGGVQSGSDLLIEPTMKWRGNWLDANFRCVADTSAANFNQRFNLTLKTFEGRSHVQSDRECLIAQWFFGEGMKRGASIITGSRYAHAQQPTVMKADNPKGIGLVEEKRDAQQKPEPSKPAEFRLNPDASKVWANIDAAQAELRRQYDQLENQRATLLIGAGVPQDSRSCKADDKGVVVCVKQETAKMK